MKILRLLVLSFALLPAAVLAQAWPGAHPVTVLMGFPAGSGVDVVARMLQEPMEKSLGGRLVMDYRTGAGGNLASEAVARAKPDGYTILLGTAATHGVNAALYKRLSFDVEADFTPISPLVNVSNVLTVNPAVMDVKTLKEFIALVKANPGKFNYASTGNGTGTHLAFAELTARAGLQMVHVPYKGGPEAIQSVIAGTTCCIMNQVQTVLAHWKAGKVRLLGVTTKQRVQAVADIPTIAEAGVPGYESYTWFGLFGPKGLDPAIVDRLNAAVKAALETPSVRTRLQEMGNTPRWESPADFRQTVKNDRAKWAEVVKSVGATID
ncbi:MAG TPA: tripartite tricarboxylate transporter substrate binding protein [Burkholderiales bacterium]|jgi:tripartite-type tricarboxylate transporter receptor subunit TctC|nr:tripartite tricarboxylate transporter substrate binding protein [Burkholderiales bacterium]